MNEYYVIYEQNLNICENNEKHLKSLMVCSII